MSKVTPRIPSGFVEYLPGEQIEFNRMLDVIRSTYEKYGYGPIDTPDIELSEVLLAKGGGETEQQIYRFTRGRNDLSLRFDLTVPLARYAAEHQHELVFPFRRYHIGKVHRAERAQAGRFREFYQCDIDVIGSENPSIDAEFPAVINEIFEKFNFGEFVIRINNRLILNGFFDGIGLKNISADILRVVDKMEKITRQELIDELKTVGLNETQVKQVLEFTSIDGTNDEVLSKLSALQITSEDFKDGIQKLSIVVDALRAMGVPEKRFKIDLRIARGLAYYTGTVYETNLIEYPALGSVCSGGRYDDLASYYTDTKLAGVGISIGLTRLFYKLREAGIINAKRQVPADVIIMPLGQDQEQQAFKLATVLRDQGVPVILDGEPSSIKKRMKYVDRTGCKLLLILGEEEIFSNTVTLKNMQSGNSEKIPVAKLSEVIANELLD